MEFSNFAGNESMEFEHALEDYDKSQRVAEDAYVKDCVLVPTISALLKDRQPWN